MRFWLRHDTRLLIGRLTRVVLPLALLLPLMASGQTPPSSLSGAILEVSCSGIREAGTSRSSRPFREDARTTILGHPLMFTESASDSGPNVPHRECLPLVVIPQMILCVPLTLLVEVVAWFALHDDWQDEDSVSYYLTNIAVIPAVDGPAIWGIGRIFGGKGSFFKTTVGTAIGTAITVGVYALILEPSEAELDDVGGVAVIAGIPVLGGIVGFNLR